MVGELGGERKSADAGKATADHREVEDGDSESCERADGYLASARKHRPRASAQPSETAR